MSQEARKAGQTDVNRRVIVLGGYGLAGKSCASYSPTPSFMSWPLGAIEQSSKLSLDDMDRDGWRDYMGPRGPNYECLGAPHVCEPRARLWRRWTRFVYSWLCATIA